MKRITTIPFSGFYETLHDCALDDALNQMFSDRATGCEVNDGLVMRAYDKCQWREVMIDYAKEYAEQFAREFGFETMAFESMQSPRFYNFTTDRIFCEVDLSELVWMLASVPREVLDDVAAEEFTSRDGFASSYSPNVADWGDLETWDHNQLGALIAAVVRNDNPDFDQYAERDLMESAECNGYFDEWIGSCTEGIDRLYQAHDYLQNRAERRA